MKRDTRQYAKRQWTWFRRDERVRWVTVDPDDASSAVASVKKSIEGAGVFG
jgi:tRNA dimethylallyltransferase